MILQATEMLGNVSAHAFIVYVLLPLAQPLGESLFSSPMCGAMLQAATEVA